MFYIPISEQAIFKFIQKEIVPLLYFNKGQYAHEGCIDFDYRLRILK